MRKPSLWTGVLGAAIALTMVARPAFAVEETKIGVTAASNRTATVFPPVSPEHLLKNGIKDTVLGPLAEPAAPGLEVVLLGMGGMEAAAAQATYMGPKKCQVCHRAEHKVWKKTKHFKSFRTVRRNKAARGILKAGGGKRDMRKSKVCVLCHFTVGGPKKKAVAGPSCESCHGAASAWLTIHNDYGGKNVKAEQETPDHKAGRIKQAAAAGMIWPSRVYDVARNCLSCHGMTNPVLDGKALSAVIDAGHPIHAKFELVGYSQGSVRHRFYPPNVTDNQTMSGPELARLYAIGQAAALVAATEALKKTDNAKYVGVQKERLAKAKKALQAVKGSVPEAGALLASPTDAAARAFVAAIKDKDLSGALGGMLPKKDAYK